MSKNVFAVVGMWSGGLYLCEYHEESGQMVPVGLFGEKEIKCGQSFWDPKRQLLYATDEVPGRNALGDLPARQPVFGAARPQNRV